MTATQETVNSLTEGDPAPDFTLDDATGAPRRLADLWRAAPNALVLVLLRHYG